MLDLHCEWFAWSYLCNHNSGSELTVGCQSSCHDLVRSFSWYHPGLVRAHCQLSEYTHRVAVILSEADHAIALVMSEPTISSLSPQELLHESCQRLLTLEPRPCQDSWSMSRFYTYISPIAILITILQPFTCGMKFSYFYIDRILIVISQIKYTLYTWPAVHPYYWLLSPDPTVW